MTLISKSAQAKCARKMVTKTLSRKGSSRVKKVITYLNNQKRDEFVHKSPEWSSSASNFIPYDKTKPSVGQPVD